MRNQNWWKCHMAFRSSISFEIFKDKDLPWIWHELLLYILNNLEFEFAWNCTPYAIQAIGRKTTWIRIIESVFVCKEISHHKEIKQRKLEFAAMTGSLQMAKPLHCHLLNSIMEFTRPLQWKPFAKYRSS